MENRTEQWGPLQIKIKWEHAEYSDLSWLGRYSDVEPNGDTLYVDRKRGMILEPCEQTQHVFKVSKETFHAYRWNEKTLIDLLLDDCQRVMSDLEDSYYDPNDCLYAFWGETQHILEWDLPRLNYRHNESALFIPANNYLEDEVSLAERSPEFYAEVVAKYGSYLYAAAHWTARDYERRSSYGSDWDSMGCTVEVMGCGGIELGSDASWGVESDCGQDCSDEVEADCIAKAKRMATEVIDTLSAGMTEAAEFLEAEAVVA